LILNFLQTRKPPILPSLHQRAKHKSSGPRSEVAFDDDVEALRGFGSKNESSIAQLLFHFFRYYAFEFKYDESVVSVRQGRVLTRKEKGWTSNSKDGQWKLCIEEPFNTARNLGNSADPTSFRGLHGEIRRAFTHLAKLELEKMLQKYEFPAEEKPIFKRPPQTKAVLSAGPPPNSNKVKGNMRSTRGNARGGHVNTGYRRASSGATYGRNNNSMPYISSPMAPQEFLTSPEGLSNLQWAQHWQMMGKWALSTPLY
jgi:Cid1 family poly A polymerase